jgi:chorismate-pyruvate lyase
MPASRALQVHRNNQRRASLRDGLLYPLDLLYERAGVAPPLVKRIAAERIPAPYSGLLVHHNEMTSTLEGHFGGPICVRVLSSFSKGPSYFRRVLLTLKETARPVAMGAVRIRLDAFSATVRARILSQRVPLGRILSEEGVPFHSCPKAFLQVAPNPEMMGVFWMPEAQPLYGRRTELTLDGGRIGDIVEILPLV